MLQLNEPVRLFSGEVVCKWPHLDASDVENANGDPARLARMLRETYGYSQRRAEQEMDLLIREFSEKIRRAAAL